MTFYGLRNKNTKIPVGWWSESNYPGDDCYDEAFHLDVSPTPHRLWLVDQREVAQRILNRKEDVEWYNADYETPIAGEKFRARDFEVFEIIT